LYAFLISPMRTTCPAHLIILDLIILIIFAEQHKIWSSTAPYLRINRTCDNTKLVVSSDDDMFLLALQY
jgi:hypothetical protein